jgi:TetR/AcrR family fatty acid metabolism transcriptional regulator
MPKAQAKRDHLMDAALQHFGTTGFHESKMDEIAAAAGVAKGTIYLYFPNKETLYRSVMAREFYRFIAQVQSKLIGVSGMREQLRTIAEYQLMYYYHQVKYKQLFFQSPHNDPLMWVELESFMKQFVSIIGDVLVSGDVQDVPVKALAFMGMVDQFKMMIFAGQMNDEQVIEDTANKVSQLFVNGC